MTIRQIAVGLAGALLMSASMLASADASAPRKPLRAMTCLDFLQLEDAAKPEMVYWAAIHRDNGKPDVARMDVDATDRIVPVLVDRCKETPHQSFWHKVQAETRKLEKEL
jgi:acid stress chaperone HdeA